MQQHIVQKIINSKEELDTKKKLQSFLGLLRLSFRSTFVFIEPIFTNLHRLKSNENLKKWGLSHLTQKLQGYNKLIALPKTNPSLVKTCFDYGLLNTIYTHDGEELTNMYQIYYTYLVNPRTPLQMGGVI